MMDSIPWRLMNARKLLLLIPLAFCSCQKFKRYRGVEQGLARWAHNPKVGGSNPSPAIFL